MTILTLREIFAIMLGLTALALGAFVGKGILYWRARAYITAALNQIVQRKYDDARRSILRAARLNPAYRRSKDLQTLYEDLLTGNTMNIPSMADRIRIGMPNWPQSKLDQFYSKPAAMLLVIGLFWLMVVIRVLTTLF